MSKIYTRTGDQGETGLPGGKRVPKDHARIEACGAMDEANAMIGVAAANMAEGDLRGFLERIQSLLFEIGAMLANPKRVFSRPGEADTIALEREIDRLTEKLPELTHFILPGGSPVGALVHWARTAVRRAERRAVALGREEEVPVEIIKYLNRLSDYLFTLARFVNYEAGISEKEWKSDNSHNL